VQETLRKQIIDMVLATDMKQHFSIHSQFQTKMQLGGGRTSGGGGGSGSHRSSNTSKEEHKGPDDDVKSLCLQVPPCPWPPVGGGRRGA
jgi:cAMP-specific phosphodiesterase 4